jgi:hypothetical protein
LRHLRLRHRKLRAATLEPVIIAEVEITQEPAETTPEVVIMREQVETTPEAVIILEPAATIPEPVMEITLELAATLLRRRSSATAATPESSTEGMREA